VIIHTLISTFFSSFYCIIIYRKRERDMGTTHSLVTIVSVHFLMFLPSSPVENNLEWGRERESKDGNNLLKFDNCCRDDDRWSAGRPFLFLYIYTWLVVVRGIKTFSLHDHICSFNKQHKFVIKSKNYRWDKSILFLLHFNNDRPIYECM
jgi:hypothetical protein